MAKAKKQEKPIEQRLEEALVLYEKTPYKLPSNWCWVRFKSIADFGMGQTILSKQLKDNGVPVYSATEEDKIFGYIDTESNRIKLNNGDLVIPARGNSIGFVKYIEEKEACCTQTTMFCKMYNKEVSRFVFYYMKARKEDLFVYNGNAIPQITIGNISEKFAPLAPLEEQKRIVEIIEKQFAKLDEARDLIQASLDSFADRKSAILHKAFTGELTKNWREIRHKQFDWKNKKLNEVCPLITDGTHQTPTYTDESGYIFLSSKNVRTGVIDWDNIKYIPESLHKELYSRLAPHKDDILLAKNGTTGIAAIVDRDCVFDIYVSLALIRPNILEVIPKYLLYAISTPEVKQYFDSSLKGIGVPNLHLKYIRETIIPIPSLDEQEEIVRILDSIFEKEDKSKELIDMLDKIDEMKKSILARAFRGELGTSNPTDEPATDLLRKILEKK